MAIAAAAYARMLAALLPPGKLWQVTTDSVLGKLLLGLADELARVDGRVDDMLDEADPSTATELLPEYERELDLDEAATDAERRARIVARLVARQRFRPVDFQTALAPLLGQAPEDVVVIERSHAFAVSIGDEREIYRFFVYRDPDAPLVFADFTYTADATSDSVAQSNHGLLTGDGPIRTTNSGGGLPGGLAIDTDYYAIYVNDDELRVATSRANALNNVFIDITSAGTGTHTMIDQPTTTRLATNYFLESAQEQVNRMKPSHTLGQVIESIDFLYDDPFSLYDRDLMGV